MATGWGLFQLDALRRRVAPVVDRKQQAFLQKQLVRYLYPNADDGQLWIGTQTGLYIYNKEKQTYVRLTSRDGLANDYVKAICTIRIKRGRQLLEESGEGVQQVAWRVSMSPKQFAKYFKEAYGLLPSDFMRRKS